MEIQRSPLLTWSDDSQSKVHTVLQSLISNNGMQMPSIFQTREELKDCLLYATMELKNTKLAVEQELKERDEQLIHLRKLLDKAARERDEAHDRCQRLLLENIVLQQHEVEPRREKDSKNGFLSSDCEQTIVPPPMQIPTLVLPEKGRLLQAVMKAGPLLQTLLLAGPLPQWRHPPPQIESSEIPPVKISSPPLPLPPPVFLQDALLSCGRVCGKRRVPEDFDDPAAKHQKALFP